MASEPESTDEIVRRLADEDAVRGIARRYAHHVWRRDAEAVAGLFTDDAVLDTVTMPPAEGATAILAAYREIFSSPDEFLPFVAQHLVDVDGDEATGTCYLTVRGVIGERKFLGGGYYDDRYRRTPDGWRITYRKINMVPFIPLGPKRPKTTED